MHILNHTPITDRFNLYEADISVVRNIPIAPRFKVLTADV